LRCAKDGAAESRVPKSIELKIVWLAKQKSSPWQNIAEVFLGKK